MIKRNLLRVYAALVLLLGVLAWVPFVVFAILAAWYEALQDGDYPIALKDCVRAIKEGK